MNHKFLSLVAIATFGAGLGIASAASSSGRVTAQLPQLQCDRFACKTIDANTAVDLNSPNPYPVVAAPPSGQRLMWKAGCSNIFTMNPQPTFVDPFAYVVAEDVPVPLGSSHASLLASARVSLAGQPSNSGGDVGFLQIKRSSVTTWENSQVAYAFTIAGGVNPPAILYGIGVYHAVEDLASLAGTSGDPAGSIPPSIDVRLALAPQAAGAFTFLTNSVCDGRLEVTF